MLPWLNYQSNGPNSPSNDWPKFPCKDPTGKKCDYTGVWAPWLTEAQAASLYPQNYSTAAGVCKHGICSRKVRAAGGAAAGATAAGAAGAAGAAVGAGTAAAAAAADPLVRVFQCCPPPDAQDVDGASSTTRQVLKADDDGSCFPGFSAACCASQKRAEASAAYQKAQMELEEASGEATAKVFAQCKSSMSKCAQSRCPTQRLFQTRSAVLQTGALAGLRGCLQR